jgi:hypothetical protein
MNYYFQILIAFGLIFHRCQQVAGSAREHLLYEDLMATYDSRERPVANASIMTVVKLNLKTFKKLFLFKMIFFI